MCADEIVKGVPGNRQDRLSVEFRVVQAVEQVNATGSGRRQTDAQPPSKFRIATGRERGRFLMSHLNQPDGSSR